MYTITTNDNSTTAASILDTLDHLRDQLGRHLAAGGPTAWCVTDPTGVEHRGTNNLNGSIWELEATVDEIVSWALLQLVLAEHRT